jgi:hypothetical protein
VETNQPARTGLVVLLLGVVLTLLPSASAAKVGPTGATGPAGPTGATGAEGATGPSGSGNCQVCRDDGDCESGSFCCGGSNADPTATGCPRGLCIPQYSPTKTCNRSLECLAACCCAGGSAEPVGQCVPSDLCASVQNVCI